MVENSPADEQGIEAGDLLLAAVVGGRERELHWPSEWRALELELEPGSTIELIFDRAGVEKSVPLTSEARVRPGQRQDAQRLREEDRVGIVVRAATEVEARAAGLGPGAGAVVVGLSQGSPWREAGLRFEDLILAVDGEPVAHPQVLLNAIQGARRGDVLQLDVLRGGTPMRLGGKLARRDPQLSHVDLPLVFSYERERGQREYSLLLGAPALAPDRGGVGPAAVVVVLRGRGRFGPIATGKPLMRRRVRTRAARPGSSLCAALVGAACVTLLAGAGGQKQTWGRASALKAPAGATVTDASTADVNGDGIVDAIVASAGPEPLARRLSVWFARDSAQLFGVQPELTLDLTPGRGRLDGRGRRPGAGGGAGLVQRARSLRLAPG